MRTSNGTIRVISNDDIDDNGVILKEVVIEERLLWMKFRRTFRKIKGVYFIYNSKNGFYTQISWYDSDCRNYFKLPVHGN
tara:strand:+ start:32910 stop:33149 length:240 start_codon:yes stop_codon:yes gene_type:complete